MVMPIRVAINGYGRIGRNILRAFYENNYQDKIKIVAVNNLNPIDTHVHLTRYDSTHGTFNADVQAEEKGFSVNGDFIHICAERDPENLPWHDLDIDVVMECTGRFTQRAQAAKHLQAGAKKVLISAPGKEVDATVVHGVNDASIQPHHQIISNASCTTNCLAPIAQVLQQNMGIQCGLMNTVHAYTSDQQLLDNSHKDLRRARSAAHSIIPTKTGAAQAVGVVLPELEGKLEGFAMRVPTMNVSAVDFTFLPERTTDIEEINQCLQQAAEKPLKNILAINKEPLVSIDFNHHPASAIVDVTQTRQINQLFKIVAWYDNEWGFSNRMLDVAHVMMG
jgi:glyceraldehyde 3-phosphate dehydrogenase